MIVVDDEYLVRLGIKETISWNDYNIEIVGEATNGKKGLELVNELKPDIIISDIKMPIMDGLEFVKHINEINNDCRSIILSGYKDFEYAKETLENGAYTYLLKPIDNSELVNSVLNALGDLLKEREKEKYLTSLKEELPSIKHIFLLDLTSGKYTAVEKIKEKIDLLNIPINQEGYVLYCHIDNTENQEIIKESLNNFYNIINEVFNNNMNQIAGDLFDSYFVLIVSGDKELIELENLCNKALRQFEKTNSEVLSIGLSNKYFQFNKISDNFLQAKHLAKNKLFPTINTVSTSTYLSSKYRQQVVEAMQYIAENFNKNISIKMVSESLYVSESHLMHIFKDDVGKTFNECLTDYRLIIAKKMLLSGKYKIYEIAEKVGYSDVKYFSQIFRKKEGISPTDYLNQENNGEV
jgi:two-component system response regulator YesN